VTKLIRTDLSMSRLPLYGNSVHRIQYGDKIDRDTRLKLKELVASFQFIIFSMCTFIMMFGLSVIYDGLEPAIVIAQEINQVVVS
jgi:hypothetical protein